MRKFLVIFLIFIQSFFLGVNAQGNNTSFKNIAYGLETVKPYNRNNSDGFIFVDFKTNETAVLSLNNIQEVLSACENNMSNFSGGLNHSTINNSSELSPALTPYSKNLKEINKKSLLLSNEINTRAP